ILRDGKKTKIIRRNQALSQKMCSQEFGPTLPVGSAYLIAHDNRDDSGLSGLHQCQAFKAFIHRSEAAWKQGDGVGLFDENHFASEKIVENDELWIAFDGLVGLLLEWQPDVQSDAMFSTGPPLSGTHDPVASSCDNHESAFAHQLGKSFCGLINFRERVSSRRTEDSNLADRLIRGKSLRSLSEFFQ